MHFSTKNIDFFMPPPFSLGSCRGVVEHVVSPLSIHMSVRPVRNTNGFGAISFEKIGILN